MNAILLTLTILAWIYLAVSALQIGLLLFSHVYDEEIKFAKLLGVDLVGNVVRRTLLIWVVCVTWIVARALT